jgi:hypothetical protein
MDWIKQRTVMNSMLNAPQVRVNSFPSTLSLINIFLPICQVKK